jgi:ubiquinone/menaquinone biosynthesis C-methylase UbiE
MRNLLEEFLRKLRPGMKVCEIGTKGWGGRPPRHHKDLVTKTGASWFGIDLEPGDGVDIVADAHKLSKVIQPNTFDAFVAPATFEHFRKPWVVAEELAKVVKSLGYIDTHQSFPLHYYSQDYFRFSREALESCMEPHWQITAWQYANPCKIMPTYNCFAHAHDWNFEAEAWLNIQAIVEK